MSLKPKLVRADYYNIRITKNENDMFLFEYEERYDVNDQEHVTAFETMEKLKSYQEQMLSVYGKASMEFNKEDMSVKISMMAPFEKVSNFVSMEFLAFATLGKMTFLDLVSMTANSFVSNVEKADENKSMYV